MPPSRAKIRALREAIQAGKMTCANCGQRLVLTTDPFALTCGCTIITEKGIAPRGPTLPIQ